MSAFKELYDRFVRDETPRLAASVSFYMLFAMAPFLLLLMTFASFIGIDRQIRLVSQVRVLVSPEAANSIRSLIAGVSLRADLTSVVGIVSALFWALSASLLFTELRSALTLIFGGDTEPWSSRGLYSDTIDFLKARLISLFLVLVFALTALASLLITSYISFFTHHNPSFFFKLLSALVSLLIYFIAFESAYLYIPQCRISFKRASLGAAITALLFVLGKEIIAFYISRIGFHSAYGAAGSTVVLLIWVYYSALIFFMGAQLTVVLVKDKH